MAKFEGPGQKMQRAPRHRSTPKDDDEQTEIEIEMASSGRSHTQPGAAEQERTAIRDDASGTGSDAAPTKQAQARERERYRLEREVGRTAADNDGPDRGKQEPNVSREDLKKAQREADRRVAGHELPGHDH